MKIKGNYIKRTIAGEHMLVPVGQSAMEHPGLFAMNETASFIWDILQECSDTDQIVERLLEEYDTDEETARKDMNTFIGKLSELDMIEV